MGVLCFVKTGSWCVHATSVESATSPRCVCMLKKNMWEKASGDLFQLGSICSFGSGRISRCVALRSVDKDSASRRACWWRYLWYIQVRLVLAHSSHSCYTVQLKILSGRWLGNWKFLFKLKRVFATVHGPEVIDAGCTTKFAPGKSLWFFKLFLELSLFNFHFTVFFSVVCAVDSWMISWRATRDSLLWWRAREV